MIQNWMFLEIKQKSELFFILIYKKLKTASSVFFTRKVKLLYFSVAKVPELGLVVKYISEHNGSEVDVKITESLLDFIKSRKELGVSAKELKVNRNITFFIN